MRCIDGYSWGNTVMSYNTYMYCTICMGKINVCTNYIGFSRNSLSRISALGVDGGTSVSSLSLWGMVVPLFWFTRPV